MGENDENDNENDDGEGEGEGEGEEEEEGLQGKASRYLKKILGEQEDDDEPKLEIIVSCAELAGIFDPLDSTQLPFVEVYCDDDEIGETTVACGWDGNATEVTSVKPVWNQRFVFRPDGTKFYRFKVCIYHIIRNRTVVGEAGFTAADAWRAAAENKGPVALNVQLLRRGELSGILHLVLGKFNPETEKKAARAAHKSIEFYEQQAGVVDNQWDMEWMMLPPAARTDFMILGWNRERWMKNRPPESEYTCWKELTFEERFAATRLGYDIFQWDGFGEIEVLAANHAASQYFWYDWQPDDLIKLSKCSSLHRAHAYIGRDLHDRHNRPPVYDTHPEDPTHRHHQPPQGFQEEPRSDYVKEDKEVQDDNYDEEDDHEAHLYMWNDIFDHVMVGQSHDDEPVPDDDIVHLPIVYRGAPEVAPEPCMPATVTYVQPAVSQVMPAPLAPTITQVPPEPYKPAPAPITYVQPAIPQVSPTPYTPAPVTYVQPAIPQVSPTPYTPAPVTYLPQVNVPIQTYHPASHIQTETHLQPVPSTLLAQPTLQYDPRLVGTASMSNNAPPKVLTSLSKVPQEIVDYSIGSLA